MTFRILVVMLCLSKLSIAQNGIAGTWSLQNKQHVEGPEYGNALPSQLSFQQKGDSIIIESVFIGTDGQEVKGRQAVSLDGKPSTTTSAVSRRKCIRSLKWSADKKSLTVTSVFYVEDNPNEVDLTRLEVFTPSADGQQLNIDKRSIETRSEDWQVKGTYAKK